MTVSVTVLGVAVALLGVLVVGLLRSHAEVLRRLHELGAGVYDDELPERAGGSRRVAAPEVRTREGVAPPRPTGTPAHDIAGATPRGEAMAVGIVGAPHTTLLAFLTTGCSTCGGFWEAFADGPPADLPDVGAGGTRLVVVTRGPEQESPGDVERLAPVGLTTVMSTSAFTDYEVPVNPYFILVDGPSGQVIGEGAAATWSQVAGLLARAAADQGFDLGDLGVLDELTAGPPVDDFEDLRLAVAGDEVDDYDDEGYDDEGYDDGVLLDGGYEDGYDDDAYDEDEDDGLELEPEPEPLLRAELPDRITIGDDGWVIEEPRPLGRLDSRQRDALAEAELFVAGIGPGHPSLYPDRLQDEPVVPEDT